MTTLKNVFILTMLSFLLSCGKEDSSDPKAISCFDYSPKIELRTGDDVQFSNCSENATSYAWDFGDGLISTETTPVHSYTKSGVYDVKMLAINENGADSVSSKITILDKSRKDILCGGTWILTIMNEIVADPSTAWYFKFNTEGTYDGKMDNSFKDFPWSLEENETILDLGFDLVPIISLTETEMEVNWPVHVNSSIVYWPCLFKR